MTHALQVLHTLQWHILLGEHFLNWLKPQLRTTTPTRTLYWVTRDWGCPAGGTYQGAFAHSPTALLHVPPQGGSPTWGKGAVAASSTLQRVLPREVTHVRPKSHIPLLRADDTCGRVPPHILINLRIPGPRGPEPGQRPCPAGTPTWVGLQ